MKRTLVFAALRFAIPGMALIAQLSAQDVTVSPSTWVYPDNPPDQLPVLRHKLEPDIPAKLHNAADIGYATHDAFVDATGRVLTSSPHATAPAFERDGYLLQVEGSASELALY